MDVKLATLKISNTKKNKFKNKEDELVVDKIQQNDPLLEPQLAAKCLAEVRQIIKADGKLVVPKDDIFLLRFIRAKKYKPDVVYQNLKKYYEARVKYPKSFAHFYPTNFRTVLESGVISLLKHRDDLGRKTFMVKLAKWDTDVISMEDMTMTCLLVAEQMSWCPINQCAGAVILIDQSGLGLNHVRQLTFPAVHKVVSLLQDNFPGRYKALHLINQPYILDVLMVLTKRVIAKRLVSRMHLHREGNSLLKMVSPDILPVSLGGNLPEESAYDEEIFPNMLKMDEYYKELLNYGFKSDIED